MNFITYCINLLIFIWGTICLDGFRLALKYNALGEYTETNIDINTLLSLTVLNSIIIVTNYRNIVIINVLNVIATFLIGVVILYNYTHCHYECLGFYDGHRFNYYWALLSILPYLQFVLGILLTLITIRKREIPKVLENNNNYEYSEVTRVI
tara:strand:+ start:872 stop:1327 length:456 start_codon:yes stop_codon:yes gene_type:complete